MDSLNVRLGGRALSGLCEVTFYDTTTGYCYMGGGERFMVMDVTDPAHPTEVGHCYVTDLIRDIYIVGDYAYIADYKDGFYILDVSYFTIFSNIIECGWNLVSIPSTTPEAVGSFGPSVFGYDNTAADYIAQESMFGKKGYWALGMATDTVAVGNDMAFYEDTLYRGWNLVVAVCHPISYSHISTDPPGLVMSQPYGWDGADYFDADSLYPGKGYWFLSTGHGRITVGP